MSLLLLMERPDALAKANPNHDRRGRFSSVFAPVRGKGEQRGKTLAAMALDATQIPALAQATADLLARTAPVRLPNKTGPTLRADALRAARKAAAYMRHHGLAIRNHGSGALIELSTRGLKHAKSHTGDERAALLMFKLPSALARAVYFKTEQPDSRKAQHTGIVAYHKFAVPVEDRGGLALAILHVEEDGRGAFYYDAAVSPEIERLGGKPPERRADSHGGRVPGRLQAYREIILAALEVKPGLGELRTFLRKALAPWATSLIPEPRMASLIDLSAVPCNCADHGLETLHKAIAEAPSEAAIWRAHESPWIRALIEREHGAMALHIQAAQEALFGALGLGRPLALLRKADPVDLEALRARLAKPMGDYTPADWLALVELIWTTRLPADALAHAADTLTAKATLAGHLQAMADGRGTLVDAATLAALMDRWGKAAMPPDMPLAALEREAMAFARARVGLNLAGVSDAGKARVARSILEHVQEHGLASPRKLEQTLLDDFGTMNRDWRRIAVTEAGEVANVAYAASHPDGTRLKRIEAYEGACPFCRKLDGQVFTWSSKPRPDRDGWTHVWPGKTNVGRSASPRKQTPEGLVERTDAELWWPAAGVQHPSCRGRWLSLPSETPPPGVDPEFHAWLKRELAT